MKQHSKIIYDKMVDFKRLAVLLLAVGVFFYLGSIIPSETKTMMDLNIMVFSSISFLLVAIIFFIQSKKCQSKLNEMENGQNQ
ncbi:MAG: putative rane protein [Neobacillus sp.]|jgi:large-conductance mechanosensitive channel|nr:putative rane protein [Neobacillus sp.]